MVFPVVVKLASVKCYVRRSLLAGYSVLYEILLNVHAIPKDRFNGRVDSVFLA